MLNIKYAEILKRNREMGADMKNQVFRIALLSNIVVEQLGGLIEFALRSEGINVQIVIGDYDNIVQDSLLLKNLNAVIVFWEAANLVDGLHAKINSMSIDENIRLAEHAEQKIDIVCSNLKNVPLVFFNRFSSNIFSGVELQEGALRKLCKRLNAYLEMRVMNSQILVDMDSIISMVGVSKASDLRLYQTSKALYSIQFLKMYATVLVPAFRAITGRARKVLVLDCDNTLWGGILGEEGEDGIEMGVHSQTGKIYNEVQLIIKGLKKSGVLIALCSKNNSNDVENILANHPDCVLSESDLVAKKVNWQDKATNLRELAIELNLGLDSFIFIDDSDFELGLVAKELPQVKCVQVPRELSDYPSLMRTLANDFFTFAKTDEDAVKTEMYRAEIVRKDQAKKFKTIDDYLQSLRINLKVLWTENIPVQRFAQMTQKTNQFNLTTRRYSEVEIMKMLKDENFMLSAFSVADLHGEYGITALAIIKLDHKNKNAVIDSLLMSCRIIGRNIEYIIFDIMIAKLKLIGINKIMAHYISTPKNVQVSDFYDKVGMRCIKRSIDFHTYDMQLSDYKKSSINYIEISESN